MRPIAEVLAWFQQANPDVQLYSGDVEGGFIKGHFNDQQARESIAAQVAHEDSYYEDDQEAADRWDTARVQRGHFRKYPCLNGCDEHDPRRGWHVAPSKPGRGAFKATEVTS